MNKELDLAWNFVQNTNRNIFLTGNAGTGKTTFLRELKKKSHKRMVITAPTGVAAINAGGVTLHSFFQLPFGPILTEAVTGIKGANRESAYKFQKKKINIIKTLDLLVIDEISMVRADLLDAIDEVLRKYRDRYKPFGGVQLLMIGDLEQLAPVVKNDDWALLRPYYPSVYFFNSKAAIASNFITIELKHIYRQNDEKFIEVLNQVRGNKLSQQSIETLNKRFLKDFTPTDDYIILTTHNANADSINSKKMNELKGKSYFFEAKVEGTFSEYAYPADFKIEIKVNARVMFIKNDSSFEKRYYNGKIGIVKEITEDDEIVVVCEDDGIPIYTLPETWANIRYDLDEATGEMKESTIGSFTQYPLRLAWAITIHKSQGLTFEKAVIDAESAFAHGQTYVALSRCKSLEGLVLSSRIGQNSIISDSNVSEFNTKNKENPPTEKDFLESKYHFQKQLLEELFNYRQLRYRLEKIEGIVLDNSKVIFGQIKENIELVMKNILPNLQSVAAKFNQQVEQILEKNPDTETNDFFNERLKKAAVYFYEQHENEIIQKLFGGFETDNKEIRKQLQEQLTALEEILNIRQAMLKAAQSGFNISEIIKGRTQGTFKTSAVGRKTKQETSVTTHHPELYELIKYWRTETARDLEIAPNQILLQKTMIDISNSLPRNLKELRKIEGIGRVKIRDYGQQIVELVEEYLETKGLRKTQPVEKSIEKKEKSHEITWRLLKTGMTIEEVARERNFAQGTIEDHILQCIDEEDFNYQDFVDVKKTKEILAALLEEETPILSEIKPLLSPQISWFQLKLVAKFREKLLPEINNIK
ncbi:MAG: helix-turn-helix domain-containing protein [Bacteroidales bacterium]|nr:helix-turn-helix domain-containing protein [Bacteroidales bacterium]